MYVSNKLWFHLLSWLPYSVSVALKMHGNDWISYKIIGVHHVDVLKIDQGLFIWPNCLTKILKCPTMIKARNKISHRIQASRNADKVFEISRHTCSILMLLHWNTCTSFYHKLLRTADAASEAHDTSLFPNFAAEIGRHGGCAGAAPGSASVWHIALKQYRVICSQGG